MTDALRFDRLDMGEGARFTEDGFLEAEPIVTRTGIFTYVNADGSTRRELRHPDEVLRKDAMDSLRMLPVTLHHPPERIVTSKNAKALAVGYTGQLVRADGQFIVAPIRVTDGEAVDSVKSGATRQLSLGYRVDVVMEPGEFGGERYDARQTNIRYNHLALVPRGRAGEAASIKLDAADASCVMDDEPTPKEGQSMATPETTLAVVTLDGIEYRSAPEVKNALEKARNDAAETKRECDKLRADAEKANAERDALAEKAAKLEKQDHSKEIAERVKTRVDLFDVARQALDEETTAKLDSMSDDEIRRAVILAKSPEAKLDGKSEDYVAARFDVAREQVKTDADAEPARKQAASALGGGRRTTKVDSIEDARNKMIERQQKQSLGLGGK